MRYFFDTEFIEDGKTIDLLSIGVVAEDGRELYMENSEADFTKASPWVREHVFTQMRWTPAVTRYRIEMAADLRLFCDPGKYGKPEFWAYYADYDWVVLCQLYGRMIDLPKGWPMYCRDFKQWLDSPMAPNTPLEKLPEDQAHNALDDARWLKREFDKLTANSAMGR